jgi:hypothetical protein
MAEVVDLVLSDGTPSGLMVANLQNWNGVIVSCPRILLEELKARPEVHKAGIYLLWGDDPESDGGKLSYVGEGDRIWDRISSHNRQKDFWTHVIGITTSTGEVDISKSHVRYLEALTIRELARIGRVRLEQNKPTPPKINESMRISMETFFDKMTRVLPLLGFPFLTPLLNESTSGAIASGPLFVLKSKGVEARAILTNSGLVVLKGSKASTEDAESWTNGRQLRARLIKEGALTLVGEELEFSRNVEFSSASAAACVVRACQSPGPILWFEESSGLTYKEYMANLSDQSIN